MLWSRRRFVGACGSALAVPLAGCGDGGGSAASGQSLQIAAASPTPSPSPTPTSTPTPTPTTSSASPPVGFADNGAANPALRAMLARVAAGTGRGKIAFVGDSLLQGQGAGAGGLFAIGARAYRVPLLLAAELSAYGHPAIDRGLMGDAGMAATGAATLPAFDGRVSGVVGYDDVGNLLLPGGGRLSPVGIGPFSVSFTETSVSAFEIVFYDSVAGTATLRIDGAAPVEGPATFAGSAAGGFARVVVSAGAVGTHTLTIAGSGAAPAIRSIRAYAPSVPAIDVVVLAACGAQSGQQAATTADGSGCRDALAAEAPDLTVIQLGANDLAGGGSIDAYGAAIRQIVATARVSGDVLLAVFHPAGGAYGTNQSGLRDATAAIAVNAGVASMSLFDYFGGAFTTALRVRMADGLVHGTLDLQQEEAQVFRLAILAMAQ